MRLRLDRLQPLGRALMLPIAVLPVAGLLLRLGQPDLLDLPFIAAAGNAIFSNLGLLFAIGVAVGIARENHGAAGLAGAVAYFVTVEGAKVLLAVPPEAVEGFSDPAARDLAIAAFKASQLAKLSVPAGILAGLTAGALYNRFANIQLPEYLAFFGGRRFVPIAAGLAGVFGAMIFGLGFPYLEQAIDALSRWVVGAGNVGLFLYGMLNRLLIITGLHHILNNIAWFILGEYEGATGDLKRFFAGDPTAGAFMAGFFPVMMFGLPAACLAMYHTALPERRRAVGGLLASLALTSFLTGVTEPIEFAFMFLAPALYVLHAVLTGLSMVVMNTLGVKLGFGFSAGLFDYLLNVPLSTRPWLLLPVGAAYGGLYYLAFRYCILRFDLKTPGREPTPATGPAPSLTTERGPAFVASLGGAANLVSVDACTTRLRLEVVDLAGVDEAALRSLGARGFVRAGPTSYQVILGPIADQVASEMRAAASAGSLHEPGTGERSAPPAASIPSERVATLLEQLGGAENLAAVGTNLTRVCVRLRRRDHVDLGSLSVTGLRGVMPIGEDGVHLLFGCDALAWRDALADLPKSA